MTWARLGTIKNRLKLITADNALFDSLCLTTAVLLIPCPEHGAATLLALRHEVTAGKIVARFTASGAGIEIALHACLPHMR
jgi:hypothetical protein